MAWLAVVAPRWGHVGVSLACGQGLHRSSSPSSTGSPLWLLDWLLCFSALLDILGEPAELDQPASGRPDPLGPKAVAAPSLGIYGFATALRAGMTPSSTSNEGCLVIVIATLLILVVGALFGLLAYLVVPGRRNVPIWAAILTGMISMPLGSLLANLFGVGNTQGVDWIELLIQLALAVVGVAIVAGLRSRHRVA